MLFIYINKTTPTQAQPLSAWVYHCLSVWYKQTASPRPLPSCLLCLDGSGEVWGYIPFQLGTTKLIREKWPARPQPPFLTHECGSTLKCSTGWVWSRKWPAPWSHLPTKAVRFGSSLWKSQPLLLLNTELNGRDLQQLRAGVFCSMGPFGKRAVSTCWHLTVRRSLQMPCPFHGKRHQWAYNPWIYLFSLSSNHQPHGRECVYRQNARLCQNKQFVTSHSDVALSKMTAFHVCFDRVSQDKACNNRTSLNSWLTDTLSHFLTRFYLIHLTSILMSCPVAAVFWWLINSCIFGYAFLSEAFWEIN